MKKKEVEIFLPKFKMEFSSELSHPLQKMGMTDAFREGMADFSGIDQSNGLYLSRIFRKAWIEVSEEGTEAAAATVVAVPEAIGFGAEPPRPPVFRADHPFIFFIRDRPSGSVLFLGRLADPKD